METATDWRFNIDSADDARWTEGLRRIFDYRDLGVTAATNGDYVAHLIRANGRTESDAVQQWHIHECTFQMVYVLNGWATFEYADVGERTIRKGDCINQRPGIPHREIAVSDDFEVLEVVAPADFRTVVVDPPG